MVIDNGLRSDQSVPLQSASFWGGREANVGGGVGGGVSTSHLAQERFGGMGNVLYTVISSEFPSHKAPCAAWRWCTGLVGFPLTQ